MNRYCFKDEKGEHLHQLNINGTWRPLIGVSTVIQVIAKPLTWWASGMAVETFGCPSAKVLTKIKNNKATAKEKADHYYALTSFLGRLRSMSADEYADLIDKAYRAHDQYKRERAVEGTDLHAELERFINDEIEAGWGSDSGDYLPQIQNFIHWSRQNIKRYLWSEGHSYSEKHWIGGISDAGYETLDGKFGILDFKSSKEAYMSHFWQCGGYDLAISESGVLDKDGNKLLTLPQPISEYAVFPFGAGAKEPSIYHSPQTAREVFLAALTIHKATPE
jgi:hypothetical protein